MRKPDTTSDIASSLLAFIVESSDDAIISKSLDGIVTSWNRGAEQIFGYRADEIIGRPISVLAAPGHEDEMPRILLRVAAGHHIDHYETSRRHKGGKIILISLTVSPILDREGHIVGASKIARNITATRLAEAALIAARERMEEQQRHLLHALRIGELGQMAATLAHEIRQPLTAIKNSVAATSRYLDGDIVANLDLIRLAMGLVEEQTTRTVDIARRLMAFSKPQAGLVQPESLNAILLEATGLATIDAKTRGVALHTAFAETADIVFADRVEIQQVVLNLIRNALDAMDGQPRRSLTIATQSSSCFMEVAVSDTGPGIAPELKDSLFDSFVTSKEDGMGIGLAICRRIVVEHHGGRFWADEPVAGGATFRFTLRRAQVGAALQ